MSKITRQTQKIFGGQAPNNDLAVFGSFKSGSPIYTDNIEDLQSTAYEQGWSAALAANEAPFMEEMNGVQYGFSKQLAYQFQEGVAEYDPNTTYFKGSFVKGPNTNNVPVIYYSLTDDNLGNDLSNTTYWQEWISGANTDLSNLTQAGINNITQIIDSKAITTNRLTNCITSIPERIKATLVDGVMTIKAGSVVIFPYGITDQSSNYPVGSQFLSNRLKVHSTVYTSGKFFVWAELTQDIVRDYSTATYSGSVLISQGGGISGGTNAYSGATTAAPASRNYFYYDTTKNVVTYYENGVDQNYTDSFPIMRVTLPASINQVFNGLGYIGNTYWVDKDVKFLLADGRNSDGTVNNIEYTNTKIITYTTSNTNHYNALWFSLMNGTNPALSNFYADNIHTIKNRGELPDAAEKDYQVYYIEDEAVWVYNANLKVWQVRPSVIMGYNYLDANNLITEFSPKGTFLAVDYNEYRNTVQTLEGYAANPRITQTYSNGSSWYRIWSDGWCEQGGVVNGDNVTITFLIKMANTNYTRWVTGSSTSNTASGHNYMNTLTTTSAVVRGFNETAWGIAGYKA